MAHVEKYTIGAVGHMFKHYERAKDDKGEYIKFGNQNIDLAKTGTNYNMATDQKLPQLAFINKRLKEVKVQQRKDVNVMCSWVVTLPQGMDKEEKHFFEATFQFLSERYGKENVVSAYVHRDESQPHMHFSFIPVVADKKKKRLKVSAKELLNRQELQRFHEDLEKYLFGVFQRDVGVRNDATKLGNKTVRELKRQTALRKQQALEEEVAILEDTRDYYHKEYDELQKDSDILHRMLDNNPDLIDEYRTAKREVLAENSQSEME